MAQIIQIPFSFEFRSVAVEWTRVPAALMGWSIAPNGAEDHMHLIAKIEQGKKAKPIVLPLAEFPAPERKKFLAVSKNAKADGVKQMFTSIGLDIFVPGSQLPISNRELRAHSQPANAWLMRDDFLRLSPDLEEVQAFLNKWGRWHPMRGYAETRQMFGLQRAVKDALIVSPDQWFASGNASLPVASSKASKFPYFNMLTDACQVAICMATTIDLLRQLEFKTCARNDCAMPFQITSKHTRAYCSQYCAHLESVRRSRRPKTAKQKKGA